MRKTLTATAFAAALTVIPVNAAFATTPPDDPNDVEAIDNPADENDESGFDDWGCLACSASWGWPDWRAANESSTRTYDDRTVTR